MLHTVELPQYLHRKMLSEEGCSKLIEFQAHPGIRQKFNKIGSYTVATMLDQYINGSERQTKGFRAFEKATIKAVETCHEQKYLLLTSLVGL